MLPETAKSDCFRELFTDRLLFLSNYFYEIIFVN